MSKPSVRVLLGVDCDRPRIEYQDTPSYQSELTTVADYLAGLIDLWGSAGASWTLFLCGSFLEALASAKLGPQIQATIRRDRQCEVGCHTFGHRPVANVPLRPDLSAMSAAEFEADLQRNQAVLEKFTGRYGINSRFGFRAPYGTFAGGLSTEIIQVIRARRSYSSSVLRSRSHGICPLLTNGHTLRQPFQYPGGLWELPSHGWHDTVFARLSATVPAGMEPSSALNHYSALLGEATELSRAHQRPIYVGLVLHPLAMSIYDPKYSLLSQLESSVPPDAQVSFWSYQRGYESLRDATAK